MTDTSVFATGSPITDVYFYNNRYVDYVVSEMIDKYRDKRWKRSMDVQRTAVHWKPEIALMKINNQYNDEYGFRIIRPTFKERFDAKNPMSMEEWMKNVTMTGVIERDILPYYNKKTFLQKYGYNKEIPLTTIMKDTSTFSKRIMCVGFEGLYTFDDVSFILRPGDTTLVVIKGEHSTFLCQMYLFYMYTYTDYATSPNPDPTIDPIDQMMAMDGVPEVFSLRFFFEPQSSVYHKTGRARDLVSPFSTTVHSPVTDLSSWEIVSDKRKINSAKTYSIYINKKATSFNKDFSSIGITKIPDNLLLDYFTKNKATGKPHNLNPSYVVWNMHSQIDDLMESMATSELTDQFEIYVIEDYRKMGSVLMDYHTFESLLPPPKIIPANPTLPFIMNIPFLDNIVHPYNIIPYVWRLPAVYSSFGGNDLFLDDYGPVTNTPHMYWQYNGSVEKPGATLSPLYNYSLDRVYKEYLYKSDPDDNPSNNPSPVPAGAEPTIYEMIEGWNIYGIFLNQGIEITPINFTNITDPVNEHMVYQFDYYEADVDVVKAGFFCPGRRYIDFYREFYVNKYMSDGSNNPVNQWIREVDPYNQDFNYSIQDYFDSEFYGDIRAYKMSKFVKLIEENPDVLQEYVERVNDIHKEFKQFEIDWTELSKDGRTPVMDTSLMHQSPEEVVHFSEPQIYIKMTTSIDVPKEIESFVNGKRVDSTAVITIAGESWVFLPASVVDRSFGNPTIIIDVAEYPDNPTESKRHGQFTVPDLNTPIPFPNGFGSVSSSDLIFYDSVTKEYIDIFSNFELTEYKDTVEVENEMGDPEKIIVSDQPDLAIYLRTVLGGFYKTSLSERWKLQSAKTPLPIPPDPYINKEFDSSNTVITTNNPDMIGKTVSVTTTDNHRKAKKEHVTPDDNSIIMPNWGEALDGSRFMVYLDGELLVEFEDYTINWPIRYGDDLTIDILKFNQYGENNVIIDYLPYSQKYYFDPGHTFLGDITFGNGPLISNWEISFENPIPKSITPRLAPEPPWLSLSREPGISRPTDLRYSKLYLDGRRVAPSVICKCDGMNVFSLKKYNYPISKISMFAPMTDSLKFVNRFQTSVGVRSDRSMIRTWMYDSFIPFASDVDYNFSVDAVHHTELKDRNNDGTVIEFDLTDPDLWESIRIMFEEMSSEFTNPVDPSLNNYRFWTDPSVMSVAAFAPIDHTISSLMYTEYNPTGTTGYTPIYKLPFKPIFDDAGLVTGLEATDDKIKKVLDLSLKGYPFPLGRGVLGFTIFSVDTQDNVVDTEVIDIVDIKSNELQTNPVTTQWKWRYFMLEGFVG